MSFRNTRFDVLIHASLRVVPQQLPSLLQKPQVYHAGRSREQSAKHLIPAGESQAMWWSVSSSIIGSHGVLAATPPQGNSKPSKGKTRSPINNGNSPHTTANDGAGSGSSSKCVPCTPFGNTPIQSARVDFGAVPEGFRTLPEQMFPPRENVDSRTVCYLRREEHHCT